MSLHKPPEIRVYERDNSEFTVRLQPRTFVLTFDGQVCSVAHRWYRTNSDTYQRTLFFGEKPAKNAAVRWNKKFMTEKFAYKEIT